MPPPNPCLYIYIYIENNFGKRWSFEKEKRSQRTLCPACWTNILICSSSLPEYLHVSGAFHATCRFGSLKLLFFYPPTSDKTSDMSGCPQGFRANPKFVHRTAHGNPQQIRRVMNTKRCPPKVTRHMNKQEMQMNFFLNTMSVQHIHSEAQTARKHNTCPPPPFWVNSTFGWGASVRGGGEWRFYSCERAAFPISHCREGACLCLEGGSVSSD